MEQDKKTHFLSCLPISGNLILRETSKLTGRVHVQWSTLGNQFLHMLQSTATSRAPFSLRYCAKFECRNNVSDAHKRQIFDTRKMPSN